MHGVCHDIGITGIQSWQEIIRYLQLTFQLVLSLFLKRETPVGT